jgi:hypothetical protein
MRSLSRIKNRRRPQRSARLTKIPPLLDRLTELQEPVLQPNQLPQKKISRVQEMSKMPRRSQL